MPMRGVPLRGNRNVLSKNLRKPDAYLICLPQKRGRFTARPRFFGLVSSGRRLR